MFRTMVLGALVVSPLLVFASHSHHQTATSGYERPPTSSQYQRLALLRRLIEAQQWTDLATQVTVGAQSHEICLQDLQELCLTYQRTPFANAVQGTAAILGIKETTGLRLDSTFPIVLFAETSLPEEILKGTLFWSKHRYGRELQYDPDTKKFFIHLGTKGVEKIGEGRKKIVTKTILYDRCSPEVMARGVTTWDISQEFTAMRRLKGAACVLQSEALMKHKDPSTHKTYMTIVTKIFRPGSLQSVIDNKSLKLTLKERLKIACDIVTGLAAIHGRNYLHRDLGARNYFVNIEGSKPDRRTINAVVADMGRALAFFLADKVPVQGNSCYLSPEGFFRSKMKPWHYYDSDVFALGCVMWQLLYGDLPEWGKKRFFRQESLPLKKRHEKHLALLKRTRSRPVKYLREKQEKKIPLSVRDRFLALILQMTDPDPLHRGKAVDLRNEFLALYNEAALRG